MNIIETNLKFNGALTYNNCPNKIVLHNADASNCTIEDIHSWHLANGWLGCGYQFLVRKDGSVYRGRPENAQGSHCPSVNKSSIGICFEGAYMTEIMPEVQYKASIELLQYLFNKYGVLAIYGHKELFETDCPGTNFPLEEFKNMKVSLNKIGWNKDETGWYYTTNEYGWYYKDCWKEIDNEWYYFNSDGYAVQSTWTKYKDKWYYLTSDCSMAKNQWLWIDGECYYFYSDGSMACNTITPDGYRVNKTGAWIH